MAPHVFLAALIGAFYGVLFHLWRGDSFQDLLIYFIVGIIGFGLGQIAANLIHIKLVMIGPLHILEATAISWGSLFIAQWLKIS